jgi:uncharacterized protein with von Willebrand factor type A (vWA) domain
MIQREGQPHINRKLFDFIEVLRDASIIISADEVIALFNAVPEIDVSDKDVFRQSLKTTLVKDYTDIPVFNRCFDQFFSGRERFFDGMDISSLSSLRDGIPAEVIEDMKRHAG